ncbi:MAG TPA: hypothetical protein VGM05_17595 [Planctomycetaceae bacterium]|jgi:hypothetical protein
MSHQGPGPRVKEYVEWAYVLIHVIPETIAACAHYASAIAPSVVCVDWRPWASVLAVTSAICARAIWNWKQPPGRVGRVALFATPAAALFVAVYVWLRPPPEPYLTWTHVGIHDGDSDLEPFKDQIGGHILLSNLFAQVQDLNALSEARRKGGYEVATGQPGQPEQLMGENYICFKSNRLCRCPTELRCASGFDARIGVAFLNAGGTSRKLEQVDSSIVISHGEQHVHAGCHLLLFVFPVNEKTLNRIQTNRGWTLESAIETSWPETGQGNHH